MIFLPHTSTVILLEPYCGTITEPGLPVVQLSSQLHNFLNARQRQEGLPLEILDGLL